MALLASDFDELVRGDWLRLVRLATLLVGDQASAEDVVQESCTALFRRWDRMTDLAGAHGYLRTSVVNGSRSVLRHRRVATLAQPRLAGPQPPAADDAVLAEEDCREVMVALTALPRRQREVIVLRYWAELSEQQIAEVLHISRGSVKSAASRGVSALSAAVGGIR
jgi:RNA polymerase sigma-70 factor (sigma-E family)